MIALHGAVALAEVHGAAVAIGEDLDLDVAPTLDQALQIHAITAERRARLGLCFGVRAIDVGGRTRDPHAAPTAAILRLEQHGKADLGRDRTRLLRVREHAVAAGNHREPVRAHRRLRARLAAHQRRDMRRRPDERDAVLRAQRREQRILRQEAPARMQRRAARLHGGLHDALDVEIRLRGAPGPEHDDLAAVQIRRAAIGFARREHRHDAERVTRTRDAHRDIAAIRDQQPMKQRGCHAGDVTPT